MYAGGGRGGGLKQHASTENDNSSIYFFEISELILLIIQFEILKNLCTNISHILFAFRGRP